MRINVDVDCVVADFIGAICTLADQPNSRKLATKFNWYKTAYGPEVATRIEAWLNESSWWENLPMLDKAEEGIDFLRSQGHQITWCTAPRKICYGWVDARRNWLNKNFNAHKHRDAFVPTHDKYLVQATAMIDDTAYMVRDWEKYNPKGMAFLYESEMNKNENIERVSWDSIMSMRFFKHEGNITQLT